MSDEVEPLRIIGVGYLDRRQPRIVSNPRMNVCSILGDEYDDVVLLQETGAGYPTLQSDQVGSIVARHIADFAGRYYGFEEVNNDRDLISIKQEVLYERKRSGRILWKLFKRIASHQGIGDAKLSYESPFSFR